MSVRQLPNGRWVLDYYPQGRAGKRVRKVLPEDYTEKKAVEFDAAIRGVRKASAPDIKQAAPFSTVKELLPDYLEWYALHRAPTTLADLKLICNRHWKRYLADYRATEIAPNMHLCFSTPGRFPIRLEFHQALCSLQSHFNIVLRAPLRVSTTGHLCEAGSQNISRLDPLSKKKALITLGK